MSIFGFLSHLQTFVGVADITRLENFSHNAHCYEYFFTPSRVKAVMQKGARLILIGH